MYRIKKTFSLEKLNLLVSNCILRDFTSSTLYDQRAKNSFVLSCRMEPTLDNERFFRQSYVTSIEPPQRTGPVNVEDIKADLSTEFSLVSPGSDTSQVRKL